MKNISNRTSIAKKLFSWLGPKNLICMEDKDAHNLRTRILPLIKGKGLKSLNNILLKNLPSLYETLNGEVQIKPAISKFTLDNISLGIFGIEISTTDVGKEMMVLLDYCFKTSQTWFLYPVPPYWNAEYRKFKRCSKRLRELSIEFVNMRLKSFMEDDETRCDFLYDLLTSKNDDGSRRFSNEEIANNTVTFMLGSFDTTSTYVSSCLHRLSLNLDIQKKLQNELDNDEEFVTKQDFNKLTYLEACIYETFRLHVHNQVSKVTNEDIEIEGLFIPKGAVIYAGSFGISGNPEVFEDPWRFNPDRFVDYDWIGEKRYTILPHGLGKRSCPGEDLSYKFLKTLLANICKKFHVEALDDKVIMDSRTELPVLRLKLVHR